jgi:hypothetical protein
VGHRLECGAALERGDESEDFDSGAGFGLEEDVGADVDVDINMNRPGQSRLRFVLSGAGLDVWMSF